MLRSPGSLGSVTKALFQASPGSLKIFLNKMYTGLYESMPPNLFYVRNFLKERKKTYGLNHIL